MKNIREKISFLLSQNPKLENIDRGLSIVPDKVSLSEPNWDLIKEVSAEILEEISLGKFNKGGIGIDNNVVDIEFLKENISKIYLDDHDKFRDVISMALKSLKTDIKAQEKPWTYDNSRLGNSGLMHGHALKILNNQGQGFTLSRRAVAPRSLKGSTGLDYLRDIDNIKTISLYLEGVMFDHNPLEINNPYLWTTHEVFQEYLIKNLELSTNISDIIKEIILVKKIEK